MYTFKSIKHFLLYLHDVRNEKGISLEEAYEEHLKSLNLGEPIKTDGRELSSLMMGQAPIPVGYINVLELGHCADISQIGYLMIFNKKGPIYCTTLGRNSIVTKYMISEVDTLELYKVKGPVDVITDMGKRVEDVIGQIEVGQWRKLTSELAAVQKKPVRSDPEEYKKLMGYFTGVDLAKGGDSSGKV